MNPVRRAALFLALAFLVLTGVQAAPRRA